MTPHDACILFIGGSGWVTAFVALRAEQKQFASRCRADRIADSFMRERRAVCAARDAADEAAVSQRARADDLAEALDEREEEVAQLSAALCDASMQTARDDGIIHRLSEAVWSANHLRREAERELADLKAHPGRAMRALQLAQARPPATEARLALDPVWRQAHPDQVAA